MTMISTLGRPLTGIVVAAALLAAANASAKSIFQDRNCMFKSAVTQKGGEKLRTAVNEDQKQKDQYCSPTAYNDIRDPRDPYYNERVAKSRGYDNNRMAPAAGY